MAEKKETVTYFSLRKEVQNKSFRPIYVLQGEEPYYRQDVFTSVSVNL